MGFGHRGRWRSGTGGFKPMKIVLATAGLFAAAAISACSSSGPSPAYQDGYKSGVGDKSSASGPTQTASGVCVVGLHAGTDLLSLTGNPKCYLLTP